VTLQGTVLLRLWLYSAERAVGRGCRERQVDPLEILGPCLGVHVALCRGDPRVTEDSWTKRAAACRDDEAPCSVAKSVEAQWA